MAKNGKGSVTKPLKAVGALPMQSALIGGVSNSPGNPSMKKSGKVGSFCGGGTVQGGFKNKGMVGRR